MGDNRRGSTLLEYAVLIMAVVAALVVVRHFLAAAVGGEARQAGDVLGGGQQIDKPFVN